MKKGRAGVIAREMILAEGPVLCVCYRDLDSFGRGIPYPVLHGSLRLLGRGCAIPQMSCLFLAHLG
jgi:hypothetical protein